jgi:GT2 family glycosyltransferase
MLSTTIVIPTHRRPNILRRTLDGLKILDAPVGGFDVLVVDNADDPTTVAEVARAARAGLPVTTIVAPEGGAARARNEGARRAQGEFVLFIDDDVIPGARDMLVRHLETHESHPRAFVAGECEYLPELLEAFTSTPFGRWRVQLEQQWESEREGRPLGGGCVQIHTMSARNFSVRRELFWELNGFDERYPFAGAEDQDLSNRARAAGCALVLNKAIRVQHNESWMGLDQFCRRQQLGAHSVVYLAREFPDHLLGSDFYRENWPLTRGDPKRVAVKKRLKGLFSRPRALAGVTKLVHWAEATPLPERYLRRLYWAIVGLHLFRGVHDALSAVEAQRPR